MHGHIVLGCPRYSPMELITLTIAIIISMAQVWPSACVTSGTHVQELYMRLFSEFEKRGVRHQPESNTNRLESQLESGISEILSKMESSKID